MKKQEINFRISETLKKEFKYICDSENDTISNKLHKFIVNEIRTYKIKRLEEHPELVAIAAFEQFGIENVTVIKNSNKIINGVMNFTETYNCNFLEFVNNNKDKQIYLYYVGSDLTRNMFKAIVTHHA